MVLLIDNYDSFTYNLAQLLGALGSPPHVVRNDELTVDQIEAMQPERVVISPGPCTPGEAGVSVEVVRRLGPSTPMLGVCLGHQAIGEAFGGRTVRAGKVMHGKTAPIRHRGTGLFAGIPSPLSVARYHSLMTDPTALPDSLVVEAWTDDDGDREVQAVSHREHPVWGVQFHPESLFSDSGPKLLANFLALR